MNCDRSSKRNLAMNIAMRELSCGRMKLPEAQRLVVNLMKLTLPEIRKRCAAAPKRNPEGAHIETVDAIRGRLEEVAEAIDQGDRATAREIVEDALDMLEDFSVDLQKE